MAFAQLTYRESLRDIEACLRAQSNKLYHMGIRSQVSRNTLSNANKVRDWRIYADLAHSLIPVACQLYQGEDSGLELDQTVYALDATTIDMCLSLFPWAEFRQTKSAIKLHTLLDLRGNVGRLVVLVDVGRQPHRRALTVLRVQRLRLAAQVVADQLVGHAKDALRAAVIPFQPHDVDLRIVVFEFEDVVQVRPAPAID